MEILPEIAQRVSVRKFQAKTVGKSELKRVLEAGRLAPSAKNRQAWRFIVVKDPAVRSKITDAAYGQQAVKESPAMIAACTTNIDYKMPNGQLSYPIDIAVAASFMMLQAEHEGLGTCIVTTYDEATVKEILSVPHSMRVVLLLLLGYSAEEKSDHRSRLPLERLMSNEHW